MRRTLPALSLLLVSCLTEDPSLSKSEFAAEVAQAACEWIYACCDSQEVKLFADAAATQPECVTQLTTTYLNLYHTADEQDWNAKAAQDCVDRLRKAGETCTRTFDLATQIAACPLVASSKGPGDFCQSTWECSTKFCKNGVCANPLPEGAPCQLSEPCAMGLRCVNDTCAAQKPDGASCTTGQECISRSCGGGQCVNSPTFTCDGQN